MLYTTFNGYQAEETTTVHRGARNLPCTSTTNIRNVSKTNRIMRRMEDRERVELEFAKVLGMERLKEQNENRTETRLNKFKQLRGK